MLFLGRLTPSGIIVQGHDAEGVECPDGQARNGSSRASRRSVCGRLESGWAKSWQWRKRQGDSDLEALKYIDNSTAFPELYHDYCFCLNYFCSKKLLYITVSNPGSGKCRNSPIQLLLNILHPLRQLLCLIAINFGLQHRLELLQRVFQTPQGLEDHAIQFGLFELRLLLRCYQPTIFIYITHR